MSFPILDFLRNKSHNIFRLQTKVAYDVYLFELITGCPMNIEHLREFMILAENLNFSITAEKLFVTQSSLSRHIASIEEQLGAPLFIRHYHSLELTEIGSQFLIDISKVLRDYDNALQNVDAALSNTTTELRIGYLDAAARNILAKTVSQMIQRYPDIQLMLLPYEYGDLNITLSHGALDLALITDFGQVDQTEYDTCCIFEDHLSVVTNSAHPFAKLSSVSTELLAEENVYLPDPVAFSGFYEFTKQYLEDNGIKKDVWDYFPHINAAQLFSLAGRGVSILPSHMIANATEDICFIPLDNGAATFDIVATWNKDNPNPAIQHFISVLSGTN